jgi:hypothetical protein
MSRWVIDHSECAPDDCLPQYAFTKRACQASALRAIAEPADQLDAELPTEMTSDDALKYPIVNGCENFYVMQLATGICR